MLSKRSREGYLLIDHRNSPGVPRELMRQAGLDLAGAPGAVFESATITCCHCNAVVILNPLRTRPRNHCRRCDHYVCDNPACSAECRPFSKTIDDAQEAASRGDNAAWNAATRHLIGPTTLRTDAPAVVPASDPAADKPKLIIP